MKGDVFSYALVSPLAISSHGKENRVVITGVPDVGMNGENVLLLK